MSVIGVSDIWICSLGFSNVECCFTTNLTFEVSLNSLVLYCKYGLQHEEVQPQLALLAVPRWKVGAGALVLVGCIVSERF